MSKLRLAHLSGIIKPYVDQLNTDRNRQAYRDGLFPRADKVKDLNKRFRFDVLYAIPSEVRKSFYDEAYKLGNDTHVNSLLKSLINDL